MRKHISPDASLTAKKEPIHQNTERHEKGGFLAKSFGLVRTPSHAPSTPILSSESSDNPAHYMRKTNSSKSFQSQNSNNSNNSNGSDSRRVKTPKSSYKSTDPPADTTVTTGGATNEKSYYSLATIGGFFSLKSSSKSKNEDDNESVAESVKSKQSLKSTRSTGSKKKKNKTPVTLEETSRLNSKSREHQAAVRAINLSMWESGTQGTDMDSRVGGSVHRNPSNNRHKPREGEKFLVDDNSTVSSLGSVGAVTITQFPPSPRDDEYFRKKNSRSKYTISTPTNANIPHTNTARAMLEAEPSSEFEDMNNNNHNHNNIGNNNNYNNNEINREGERRREEEPEQEQGEEDSSMTVYRHPHTISVVAPTQKPTVTFARADKGTVLAESAAPQTASSTAPPADSGTRIPAPVPPSPSPPPPPPPVPVVAGGATGSATPQEQQGQQQQQRQIEKEEQPSLSRGPTVKELMQAAKAKETAEAKSSVNVVHLRVKKKLSSAMGVPVVKAPMTGLAATGSDSGSDPMASTNTSSARGMNSNDNVGSVTSIEISTNDSTSNESSQTREDNSVRSGSNSSSNIDTIMNTTRSSSSNPTNNIENESPAATCSTTIDDIDNNNNNDNSSSSSSKSGNSSSNSSCKENQIGGANPASEVEGDPRPFFRVRPSDKRISYKELVLRNKTKNFGELVSNELEVYLTETEFEAVFMRSREAFYALPRWRRQKCKQQLQLF
eukprot:CAMPEP_0174964172 /NCGR_PEP_ID=MMETSP0004_2-20121128/5732_1 /TAXON_ID=420556 /ORGANISM="Ochromonas sp., Strain CCMP1393" /LENGTH=722 /DNA_ID=CAMNT_0016212867 /DNA_START=88 /DNA_END=2257 /DNA_ORIENTATION=+